MPKPKDRARLFCFFFPSNPSTQTRPSVHATNTLGVKPLNKTTVRKNWETMHRVANYTGEDRNSNNQLIISTHIFPNETGSNQRSKTLPTDSLGGNLFFHLDHAC